MLLKELKLSYFRKLIQKSILSPEILVASRSRSLFHGLQLQYYIGPQPLPQQKNKRNPGYTVIRIQSHLVNHHSGQIIILHQPRYPWNKGSHFPYFSPPWNDQIIRSSNDKWLRWPFGTTFSGSQFITCRTPSWMATRLLARHHGGRKVRQETAKLWKG